jgi:peptidoglycan/LPS O-acetylase OafA/YrhL
VTESANPGTTRTTRRPLDAPVRLPQEGVLSTTEAHLTLSHSPLIRPYMPELDTLRGLAILLVLFFHGMAPPLHGELSGAGKFILAVAQFGWAGVNLFFVLSGFLITGILVDTKHRRDYFRRFYIRRALRILPAFYVFLVILLLGGWISWRFLLLSALFLANSAPLLGVPLQYGPLWSLAVEEHFYMLWPALIRRLSFRTLMLSLALIFALTPALRAFDFLLAGRPADFLALYTWFNLDGLALGALLAVWMRQPSFQRAQLARIALPLLIIGTTFTLILKHPLAAAFSMTASNIVSAGLLSCVLLVGTTRWNLLVDRPFLRFLGFISYGLYLIHVLAFRLAEMMFSRPLLVLTTNGRPTAAMLLRFVAGSAMAVLAAYLSRRSLEERFLRVGFASRSVRSTARSVAQNASQSRPG